NLGAHVNDDPVAVAENRRRLRALAGLPDEPVWLTQVHGIAVVDAASSPPGTTADACFSSTPGAVCAIQTADCLPVLFCDTSGRVVAAAHAGWRGLAAGVLEQTVAAMGRQGAAPDTILAWLGPAIGPQAFEVGDEVRTSFVGHDPAAALAFVAHGNGKWLADIFLLARQRLGASGVSRIYGGGVCTVSDHASFFSHRRDRISGRQASLIWLDSTSRA
ncbi:MAG TPA: peptidoglycan editing factor PgeF, partial [Rhodocyclaceae bacterium]|nr:peptidoglycan editing factor PgeF [Rhodocyclaceae bacterium]